MSNDIKIYTKTGDKGTTSLVGGTRVPKYHERIEVYGTLDELNAFIGLLHDQEIDPHTKKMLVGIQNKIFTAESILATEDKSLLENLPKLKEWDINILEKEIDSMNENLPPLESFILPGGHPAVSLSHVARTICRRAERLTIRLAGECEVDELIIRYLNRLSDYFFILARKLSQDFNVTETKWNAEI